MEHYDALVIGAGSAGATAALKLSKSGLRTLVIEKSPSIASDIPPKIDITQDSNIRGIVRELSLPVAWHSKRSRWFSPRCSFSLTSRIFDLFIKRGPDPDSFDTRVVKMAKDAGCELRLSTTLAELTMNGESFSQFTLDKKGKRETIKADYVVVADGSKSQFVRSCMPLLDGKNITFFQGFGVLADSLELPDPSTHIFFDSELTPGGYFYMGENPSGGQAVAAIVIDLSLAKGHPANYYFRKFAEKNAIAAKSLEHISPSNSFLGSCLAGPLSTHHHRNALFTGDAGRLLDPLLGYGVNHAIFSGYYAAESIITKGSGGNNSVVEEYESRLAKDLLPELSDGAKAKKVFNALSNKDFDKLVCFISDMSKKVDLDDFFDNPGAYSKELIFALAKKPAYFTLLRHLHRMI